jgi:hypothetical protein
MRGDSVNLDTFVVGPGARPNIRKSECYNYITGNRWDGNLALGWMLDRLDLAGVAGKRKGKRESFQPEAG